MTQENRTTLKSGFTTNLEDGGDNTAAEVRTELGDIADSAFILDTDTSDVITEGSTNLFLTSAQASAISANTAKVTNATHTGDVTGDTTLTISSGAVDIPMLSATGTPNATTYLRGDNTWATVVSSGGDVVGPASATDNAIARFDTTTGELIQNSTILLSDTGVLSPSVSGAGDLGSNALPWNDIWLGVGGDIVFANGDVVIRHSANQLVFFGASDGFKFQDPVTPINNGATPLGTTALQWADLFLASGGVINFANGNVTITHSPNTLNVNGSLTSSNLSGTNTGDQTDAQIETAYNNQVGVVSQIDAEAGISTTVERWTPQRVAQAIAALAPPTGNSGDDFQAGGTIEASQLCYLNGSGQWALADANATATSTGMLGVALESKTSGQNMNTALRGVIGNSAWALTVGGIVYVSGTAGGITQTPPSGSGDVVRIIGYAIAPTLIYFYPDSTWVEVA